ncbi:MAG: hypothetical protein JWN60_508 [Acidobacteria bacterium]|nr:hypothetical protein [Acidobacteriota bacterium]
MVRKLNQVLAGFGLLFCLIAGSAEAKGNTETRAKRQQSPITIKVTPWGPTQQEVDAAKLRTENSAPVQNLLNGTKYRLIEFSYIENENKSTGTKPPTRFRIAFYDYTNDRAIVAEGDFSGKEPVTVREEFYQPIPNDEEFNEAVSILQKDAKLGEALKSESTKTFRPMPPTSVLDGTTERLVNIGLISPKGSGANEIVSVSIKRGEIIRYPESAPKTAKAAAASCGIPSAQQGSTPYGTAGQSQVTMIQNGVTLWEMLVIRPSASSGTWTSGIEVRDVKYKGKSVLKRGHVPVLNVEYTQNKCGPYRDWQYAEGFFNAPEAGSTNPAPGIRVLANGQVATTAIESGTDTGNFQGVAIYQQNVGLGNEIVMVSELEAGWYRYITEWRFAEDGTIRPRYGFGATDSECVCYVHNHHAYWRFDFDIVNPVNKVFQIERGRKFMQPITTEINRNKNLQTKRNLLIQNSLGNEAYMLVPNLSDGTVDEFGRNDFWVLRYKNVAGGTTVQNEIDDGWQSVGGDCTPTGGSCINITKYVNNESVADQDVVVWYGAHFSHNDGANRLDPDRSGMVLTGSHVIGPDIRPVRW